MKVVKLGKKKKMNKELTEKIEKKTKELDELLEKCQTCPDIEVKNCDFCETSHKIEDTREELADLYELAAP